MTDWHKLSLSGTSPDFVFESLATLKRASAPAPDALIACFSLIEPPRVVRSASMEVVEEQPDYSLPAEDARVTVGDAVKHRRKGGKGKSKRGGARKKRRNRADDAGKEECVFGALLVSLVAKARVRR